MRRPEGVKTGKGSSGERLIFADKSPTALSSNAPHYMFRSLTPCSTMACCCQPPRSPAEPLGVTTLVLFDTE